MKYLLPLVLVLAVFAGCEAYQKVVDDPGASAAVGNVATAAGTVAATGASDESVDALGDAALEAAPSIIGAIFGEDWANLISANLPGLMSLATLILGKGD